MGFASPRRRRRRGWDMRIFARAKWTRERGDVFMGNYLIYAK